jgi:hypothetical protein
MEKSLQKKIDGGRWASSWWAGCWSRRVATSSGVVAWDDLGVSGPGSWEVAVARLLGRVRKWGLVVLRQRWVIAEQVDRIVE